MYSLRSLEDSKLSSGRLANFRIHSEHRTLSIDGRGRYFLMHKNQNVMNISPYGLISFGALAAISRIAFLNSLLSLVVISTYFKAIYIKNELI